VTWFSVPRRDAPEVFAAVKTAPTIPNRFPNSVARSPSVESPALIHAWSCPVRRASAMNAAADCALSVNPDPNPGRKPLPTTATSRST
jgi:hypothetical protein